MSELKLVPNFKMSSPEEFVTVLNSISTLVEEATFTISPEGLTFKGMDPSHVALIDIALPNACFERYDVQEELKFAVQVDEMTKALRTFDKKHSVNFEITEDKILIISDRETKIKIRLIEASSTDTPLPKIPYDSLVELSAKNLLSRLRKIEVFSDYLTINTNEIRTVLSGKGDSGEISLELEKDHEDIENIRVRNSSEGTYSLEYIIPFLKTLTKYTVAVEYSTAKPMRIEAKISNIGRLHFYLAPRVES